MLVLKKTLLQTFIIVYDSINTREKGESQTHGDVYDVIEISTCVCLLKCFDAQFSMSVSEEGFLRENSGNTPQLALGIIFLAFLLVSNWAQAPRSSD